MRNSVWMVRPLVGLVVMSGALIAQEPVAQEPAGGQPAAEESVVRESVVQESVVRESGAETPAVTIDLPELRRSVAQQLLDRADPRAPLLDHLWKSNGGALLPRDPNNGDAQALATRIAGLIDYHPESGTFAWPVIGLSDRTSLRFGPEHAWSLFLPYLSERPLEDSEVQAFGTTFVDYADAHPAIVDPLVPPVGLSLPPEILLPLTGYGGSRLFVYSPENCFDVAFKCYILCRFDDARVLLSHAIAQRQDVRYYYFRGTIEMLTGYAEDARMSALGFNTRIDVLAPPRGYVYERVNGPPAIQFRHLANYLAAPVPPGPSI